MSKQPAAETVFGNAANFEGHDLVVCGTCGYRAISWSQPGVETPFILPETKGVRDVIDKIGDRGSAPASTYLAVALGLVDALMDKCKVSEEIDELRFLRECLQSGCERTQMPISPPRVRDLGLTAVIASVPQVDSLGVKSGQTPIALGKQRRGFLSFVGDSNNGNTAQLKECPWMGPAVPRWPVLELQGSMEQQLRGLMNENFDSWHFDIFALNSLTEGRPLQFAGWEALCCSSCFSEFCIDPDRTRQYLQAIEPIYRRDSQATYHNNVHAADVTQTVHAFLEDVGVGIYFDPMDKLVTILGAAIHDLGHDGRTNAFHVNLQDQLALTYNDRSVLENYHLSIAFQLMVSADRLNMLGDLSREQSLIARREMIDCVLGTDMTMHHARVADYTQRVNDIGRDPVAWQGDARSMFALRGMLLHASDISNQAKPFSIAHNWSMMLLRECFQQGDEEKRLGLPISPLCDRSIDTSKSQTSFIEFVVKPTMTSMCLLLPKAEELCMDEMEVNLKAWTIRRDLGLVNKQFDKYLSGDESKPKAEDEAL